MPNDFFQFKQFRIDQGDCAMKVTTDGCLFGSVIELKQHDQKVLDIGAGTGLLSLMIAQRSDAYVDAIELDQAAANQAAANFAESPWSHRLVLSPVRVQQFVSGSKNCYDLIVCNPPFFQGHKKTGTAKDLALHADTLSQADLADAVTLLARKGGAFWVMYPHHEFRQFQRRMTKKGWYLRKEIFVRNRQESPVFRVIGCFETLRGSADRREMVIRNSEGAYSREFAQLLHPYYL